MPSAEPQARTSETRIERGRRLGRRYVTAAFGVLAGVFMVSTTQQLLFAVFGVDAGPVARTGPRGNCGNHLRAMTSAIDRAISVSARAEDEARATLQYRATLAPEWNDMAAIESFCAEEERGVDALAAVVRLRVAGEQLARRHARELAPLRRDVASYLPP
jgi:hypothetical protein